MSSRSSKRGGGLAVDRQVREKLEELCAAVMPGMRPELVVRVLVMQATPESAAEAFRRHLGAAGGGAAGAGVAPSGRVQPGAGARPPAGAGGRS